MSNENKNEKELMAIELNNLFSKLNDKEKFVFETIVSNGISEEKEAKEIAANIPFDKNMRFISKDTAWRSIITLVKAGIFDLQSIHTGYRTFNILKLTDIGAKLYRLQCRKEPAVQEHIRLKKEHASYLHGYMVKDVATIVEKKGWYTHISTNRKQNTLKISDGKTLIPDVIGKSGDKFDLYEVECGNHNQADFNDKCNKIMSVSRKIIIVGQNRDIVTRILKPQVEKWIQTVGKDVLKMVGMKVYLFGMSDLAAGQITYYYDMNFEEPSCCFKKPKKEEATDEQ